MSKRPGQSHIKNLLINWGGYAANLIVMFFLSPFVVGMLDSVAYGIWSLLNVIAGYMGLLDMGVRVSVGRYIAYYLGKDDEASLDETIRLGVTFLSAMGGLVLFVAVGVGWLFPHIFSNVPAAYYRTVMLLLPLMVVSVWLTAIAAIFSSVLTAYDRFDLTRGVDMVVLLFRALLTILVLQKGWGLWGLACAVCISNIIAVIGNYLYAKKQHRALRVWPFLLKKERLKEITGYGVGAFLTRAALKIIGQTDLVIAGVLISVASVREYSVGAMLVFYSGTFLGIIDRTLFPAIQRAVAREDKKLVQWLFLRQLRLAILFGVPACVGIAVFAEPFIRLWMLQPGFDGNSVVASASVMSILAIAKFPLIFIGSSATILAATGRIKISAALTVIEACVNILLSVIFAGVFGWGLTGIALGTLVATLCVRTFWVPLMACREIDLKLGRISAEFLFPALVVTTGFWSICYLAQKTFPPQTWMAFALDVASVVILYLFIGCPFLLPKEYHEKFLCKIGMTTNKPR